MADEPRAVLAARVMRTCTAHGLSIEVSESAWLRLTKGLDTYGERRFYGDTEEEWLTEALEELLDALNMLGPMREARGEEPLAVDHIAAAIRDVVAVRDVANGETP